MSNKKRIQKKRRELFLKHNEPWLVNTLNGRIVWRSKNYPSNWFDANPDQCTY